MGERRSRSEELRNALDKAVDDGKSRLNEKAVTLERSLNDKVDEMAEYLEDHNKEYKERLKELTEDLESKIEVKASTLDSDLASMTGPAESETPVLEYLQAKTVPLVDDLVRKTIATHVTAFAEETRKFSAEVDAAQGEVQTARGFTQQLKEDTERRQQEYDELTHKLSALHEEYEDYKERHRPLHQTHEESSLRDGDMASLRREEEGRHAHGDRTDRLSPPSGRYISADGRLPSSQRRDDDRPNHGDRGDSGGDRGSYDGGGYNGDRGGDRGYYGDRGGDRGYSSGGGYDGGGGGGYDGGGGGGGYDDPMYGGPRPSFNPFETVKGGDDHSSYYLGYDSSLTHAQRCHLAGVATNDSHGSPAFREVVCGRHVPADFISRVYPQARTLSDSQTRPFTQGVSKCHWNWAKSSKYSTSPTSNQFITHLASDKTTIKFCPTIVGFVHFLDEVTKQSSRHFLPFGMVDLAMPSLGWIGYVPCGLGLAKALEVGTELFRALAPVITRQCSDEDAAIVAIVDKVRDTTGSFFDLVHQLVQREIPLFEGATSPLVCPTFDDANNDLNRLVRYVENFARLQYIRGGVRDPLTAYQKSDIFLTILQKDPDFRAISTTLLRDLRARDKGWQLPQVFHMPALVTYMTDSQRGDTRQLYPPAINKVTMERTSSSGHGMADDPVVPAQVLKLLAAAAEGDAAALDQIMTAQGLQCNAVHTRSSTRRSTNTPDPVRRDKGRVRQPTRDSGTPRPGEQTLRNLMRCLACGKIGHIAKDCEMLAMYFWIVDWVKKHGADHRLRDQVLQHWEERFKSIKKYREANPRPPRTSGVNVCLSTPFACLTEVFGNIRAATSHTLPDDQIKQSIAWDTLEAETPLEFANGDLTVDLEL